MAVDPSVSLTNPIKSPTDWADAFLTALGDTITPTNQAEVVAWEAAEGGHWHNTASYNPINTTLTEPGSHPINSVGVQAYTSWAQGLQANVSTLEEIQRGYQQILADLKAGNIPGSQFASDVGNSSWGTSGSAIAGVLGQSYNPGNPPGGTSNASNTKLTSQSSGGTSGSTTSQQPLSGIGGLFQGLDSFLNPHFNSPGSNIPIVGSLFNIPGDAASAAALIASRALFTIFFMGIALGGVYVIIRKPVNAGLGIVGGVALPVARTVQAQQRIANTRSGQQITAENTIKRLEHATVIEQGRETRSERSAREKAASREAAQARAAKAFTDREEARKSAERREAERNRVRAEANKVAAERLKTHAKDADTRAKAEARRQAAAKKKTTTPRKKAS